MVDDYIFVKLWKMYSDLLNEVGIEQGYGYENCKRDKIKMDSMTVDEIKKEVQNYIL